MQHFFQDIIAQNQLFFDSLIVLIKFFLPIALSYVMGKYTSNNPRHKAINQQQLEKVYLPLYKLLFAQNISSFEHRDLLKLSNRMQNILFKNYELVFPQLHQLSAEFHQAVLLNKDYQPLLSKIKYQVCIDYESLKRKLGYPHLNAYELFKRKTIIDKVRTIWGYVFTIYVFPGMIATISMFPSHSWKPLVLYLIGFFFILHIGIKLGSENN